MIGHHWSTSSLHPNHWNTMWPEAKPVGLIPSSTLSQTSHTSAPSLSSLNCEIRKTNLCSALLLLLDWGHLFTTQRPIKIQEGRANDKGTRLSQGLVPREDGRAEVTDIPKTSLRIQICHRACTGWEKAQGIGHRPHCGGGAISSRAYALSFCV